MTTQTPPNHSRQPVAGPSPSGPAAPVQASAPLTWRYPFTGSDHQEVTDPAIYYRALGQMEDGFFPLGVNGFPHGGVHFGDASSAAFDQASGVRCLADGEIVAYMLDDKYERLHFTQDNKWAMYSTGFVLVRHYLRLPPAPDTAAQAPATDETLVFYSLSMHMADWCTYLADGALKRPGWWQGVEAFRIGTADQQSGGGVTGAIVSTEPTAAKGKKAVFRKGEPIGFLPTDSEVVVGEKRGGWGHIQSISAGHMVSATSGAIFGSDDDLDAPWYSDPDTPDILHTPPGDYGWVYLHEQHALTEPTGVGQVVIPATPIPVRAGTVLGQLGEYYDYERATLLPPVPKRQLLHLEVFADDSFNAFLDKSRARAAQLPVDQRTILVLAVGALTVPTIVRADSTLGAPRPLAKLTSTTDSPATGRWVKVQAWCSGKTHEPLQVSGAPVWIERHDLASANAATASWSKFPLQLTQAAAPASGFTQTFTRSHLDALDASNQALDDQGTHWWCLPFGNADGNPGLGWVCQVGHPSTQWQSPWAWPGFEVVDATALALTDAFERNLVVTGSADWQEAKTFAAATARVNASELFQRLEQPLSKYIRPDASGKHHALSPHTVNARAMQDAMSKPWLAEDLSHLILRYESEWGGDMARWDAITPLMRNARENWQCELQRIQKLQWWNEVKGRVEGFPASPAVYHIHPIALVGNFVSVRKRRDYDLGKLSSQYESGGRGSITVSGGQGDPGGVSYGSYQMTSKTRQRDGSFVSGGTVKKFISSSDFPWTDEFSGLNPGTPEFSQKWREVATENKNKFRNVEHEFIRKTHFDIQINTIKFRTGIDLTYHSHAINDVVWSVSVQNGPQTDVIVGAVKSLGSSAVETQQYDSSLIKAIYAERGKKNSLGKLIRFINSSANVQNGIENRYASEEKQAQAELKSEADY